MRLGDVPVWVKQWKAADFIGVTRCGTGRPGTDWNDAGRIGLVGFL